MSRALILILAAGAALTGCRPPPDEGPDERHARISRPAPPTADTGVGSPGPDACVDAGAPQPKPDAAIDASIDAGHLPPVPVPDAGDEADAGAPDDAGAAPPDSGACYGANPDPPCLRPGCILDEGGFTLEIVHVEAEYRALGVDANGALLGIRLGDYASRLWASTDGARTWRLRGELPGHDFLQMARLSDGTLLAGTVSVRGHAIARSTDAGQSWHTVLEPGDRRMLQPESISELDGEVFFAGYQSRFDGPVPIDLWASSDGGESWTVRYTFEGFRHAHGLLADEASGRLWAFMGDLTGGILRSTDSGFGWQSVVLDTEAVLVDAVSTAEGLLFATDGLYLPLRPAVKRLRADDTLQTLARLPGPSYSIHASPGGGLLLGTTRETGGDVYAACDFSAHLFGSADGWAWKEVLALPRASANDYCRVDPRWSLPTGEVVVDVANVRGFGPGGQGFLLVRMAPR